jgi:hypothetical protein
MFDPHDDDPGRHDPGRADPGRADPPPEPVAEPAGAVRISTSAGVDTDGDGIPDTLVLPAAGQDWLAVDTDDDDLADLLVRVDDHGVTECFPLGPGGPLAGLSVDELLGLAPLFDPPSWHHWPD